ncbi:nucleotidyltransferase family protein [Photobacterium sp. BZF1]|uniref:nucleotidyltransferase domain-containing protein n=1 Tax=Photobacterium sp. BZF1 TaxID=1904457 RepID=UPI001653D4B0|nr:nucleotidyltransferase family protein [Photobacterium sp. BZF1]MBC7001370.1 nucleotidyltransferase family protein [Photobacterium sp. BZF1]
MTADKVIQIYSLFQQSAITVWIDGGWGIDALLGQQTRNHSDLDIVIQIHDVEKAIQILQEKGYIKPAEANVGDHNFVMIGDTDQIDFHVVCFDDDGKGIYGPPDNNVFYPDYAFGHSGEIKGLTVNCISPKYQLESHSGYALRPCDFLDIQRLCQEFQLPTPCWLEPLS